METGRDGREGAWFGVTAAQTWWPPRLGALAATHSPIYILGMQLGELNKNFNFYALKCVSSVAL